MSPASFSCFFSASSSYIPHMCFSMLTIIVLDIPCGQKHCPQGRLEFTMGFTMKTKLRIYLIYFTAAPWTFEAQFDIRILSISRLQPLAKVDRLRPKCSEVFNRVSKGYTNGFEDSTTTYRFIKL